MTELQCQNNALTSLINLANLAHLATPITLANLLSYILLVPVLAHELIKQLAGGIHHFDVGSLDMMHNTRKIGTKEPW